MHLSTRTETVAPPPTMKLDVLSTAGVLGLSLLMAFCISGSLLGTDDRDSEQRTETGPSGGEM